MGRNLRFFLNVIAAREAELMESEQLFRTLAVTAPFPLLMVRASDGTVLTRNRRAETWLGLSGGESGFETEAPAIDAILPDEADREALRAMSLTDSSVAAVPGDGSRGSRDHG